MPHPILRAETIPHVPGPSLRPCRRSRAISVPLRPPTARPAITNNASACQKCSLVPPLLAGRGQGKGVCSRTTTLGRYPSTPKQAHQPVITYHHPPSPGHPRKLLFSGMLGCSGFPAPAPGTASCYHQRPTFYALPPLPLRGGAGGEGPASLFCLTPSPQHPILTRA